MIKKLDNDWLVGTLIAITIILLIYIILNSIYVIQNREKLSLAALNQLLVSIGVFIATISLAHNMMLKNSEEYLKKAKSMLEEAYEVLSQKGDDGKPKNDRYNWITAARLIYKAQKLSKKLIFNWQKEIYIEYEQYWRWKFWGLLEMDSGSFPLYYFTEDIESSQVWRPEQRAPISIKSITVVYRFLRWPKGVEDPLHDLKLLSIDEVNSFETLDISGMTSYLKESRSDLYMDSDDE